MSPFACDFWIQYGTNISRADTIVISSIIIESQTLADRTHLLLAAQLLDLDNGERV